MANRHIKRYSASIFIRQLQMRITSHLTKMTIKKKQEVASVGKSVEKRWLLCTVGGHVNSCKQYGKHHGGFLKKFKIDLPYDSAIPLLGIYPKKMKTLFGKEICTLMFMAALFTIVKIWKQPKWYMVSYNNGVSWI